MKKIQKSVAATVATVTASQALAHPGINDRHDVLAAIHDLAHMATVHPFLAGVVIALPLAALVIYRVYSTQAKKPDLLNAKSSR